MLRRLMLPWLTHSPLQCRLKSTHSPLVSNPAICVQINRTLVGSATTASAIEIVILRRKEAQQRRADACGTTPQPQTHALTGHNLSLFTSITLCPDGWLEGVAVYGAPVWHARTPTPPLYPVGAAGAGPWRVEGELPHTRGDPTPPTSFLLIMRKQRCRPHTNAVRLNPDGDPIRHSAWARSARSAKLVRMASRCAEPRTMAAWRAL